MINQGKRLEILMDELGFNQTKLGEELNLGQTAISALVRGKSTLSGKNLIKLSNVCKVALGKQLNLNWLMLNIGEMFIEKEPPFLDKLKKEGFEVGEDRVLRKKD
jgi:transcriptional regulator with XRE-family HTH domain